MRRLRLVLFCLVGSALGGVFGVVVGIAFDSALLAWASSAAFPILTLLGAGIRDGRLLAKNGIYALIGWGLCFVLEPVVCQSSARRAIRIASDPFVGKGWFIPCHIASGILALVGVALLPAQRLAHLRTPAVASRGDQREDHSDPNQQR